jgi:uncharacterized cupredoxin-like copper-binding protein
MRLSRLLALALLIAAAALVVAGCGSDSGSESPKKESKAGSSSSAEESGGGGSDTKLDSAPAGAATVQVEVGEGGGGMILKPSTDTAKGPVTFEVHNSGQLTHEFVILKTDTAPDALEETDGRVGEDDSVGEIGDIAPGSAEHASFDLQPGSYVLVCNLKGHYGSGMRAAFTVT